MSAPVTRSRWALPLAIATVAMEGYDLTLFAIFSVAIGKTFFPASDPANSLLLAVATLGVGYVMRPVGGIMLGAFADRAGRRTAMALTVLLMAGSTGVVGLVPGYATIGMAAPLLIVIARLVQGVAAGGATPGTLSYLVEASPPERRGYYSAYQQTAQVGALLFASGVGAATARFVSPEALNSWGWRLPFLLALLLGPIGMLIRRRLPETAAFEAVEAEPPVSVPQVVRDHWRRLLAGIGICCLLNSTTFLLLFYMPTYAQTQIGLDAGSAYLSNAVATALLAPLCLVGGLLSDRFGRRPVMLISAAGLLVFTQPLIAYAHHEATLSATMIAQCLLVLLIAAYTGSCNAVLGEIFPTRDRATCISISFNISILAFGAFAALAVTWLMKVTGDPTAIAYYVCAAAVVSLITLLLLGETGGRRLVATGVSA